jgi:sterol desaturase/sphingolipid hydroxylase (fatty acid hydroxylase superfamily)
MNRGALISWMLIPQFILVLLAVGIVWGAIKLSVRFPPSAGTRVERILCLMGNMIALPQIILGFAMLDIFSYNSYQMRIMPWWLFAAIIMGLGGIVLGIFFVLAIREILGTTRQEGFKELSDGGTSIQ